MRTINTGNVRPMRIEGKVNLEVSDIGENEFIDRFLCSVYGWHTGDNVIGMGKTQDGSIRDWCDRTGNDYDTVKRECRFISRRN